MWNLHRVKLILLIDRQRTLQNKGIHGLMSEASSLANQELLRREGYVEIGRLDYAEIRDESGKQLIHCDDGTDAMISFFKPF